MLPDKILSLPHSYFTVIRQVFVKPVLSFGLVIALLVGFDLAIAQQTPKPSHQADQAQKAANGLQAGDASKGAATSKAGAAKGTASPKGANASKGASASKVGAASKVGVTSKGAAAKKGATGQKATTVQQAKSKPAASAKAKSPGQTPEITQVARPGIKPVIPAALAGLSLVGGVATASSQNNNIAVAQTASHAGDDAFIQLREAFLHQDQAAFQRLLQQSDQTPLKEHPLYPYVQHWSLRQRLSQRPIAEVNAEPLQREVLRFLTKHDNESLAEQVRKTYIEWLADRESWAQVNLEYPKLIFQDEAALQCLFHFAKLKLSLADHEALALIAAQSKALLFSPRPLGSACGRLFSELKQLGQIDQVGLQQRLRLALESNQPGAIRWAASHLGLPAADVDRALEQPEKSLRHANPLIGQIAWVRFARQDSIEAYRRWRQAEQKNWPSTIRSFIIAQIASTSMLRMQAHALDASREALRESQGLGVSAIEAGVLGSDESLAIMARSALRAKDWDSLQQLIAWMSARGQSDPTWQYWRARAYRQAGEEQAAQALFKELAGQFHFYGQLALEDLGQPIEIPARAAKINEDELRAIAALPGVQRAFKLYQLGLRPEAHREWWVSTKPMTDRQLLAAAELACRRLVLDRCVNTADRTKLEHDFQLRFIMPFREDLEAAAARVGLDPAWAYGLIRQESRFLLDAKSSVGAQGLMQIMPTTGRWIAKKLGQGEFKTEDLQDMKTNIRFGTYYLRSVFDDLDGSQAMASAAYNAGPNRPRTWRASLPGPVEGAIFAEIIPFTETRDYVKKVLSNAVYYAAIQKQEAQSLKKRLGEIAPKAAANSLLP